MQPENKFVLRVPVDASRVQGFATDAALQLLAWSRTGETQQRVVRLDAEGMGTASFGFVGQPQEPVRVALGPEDASPYEMQRLQTISVSVPVSAWTSAHEVTLAPVPVSTWYWWWWQHWKQKFQITGRVVNPQGDPIAGATVSAFDIDAWWWWTAQEQVGETVTDDEGEFAVEFTRASGAWPWWWWATREWKADPELVGRITAFVGQYARFGSLTGPTAAPSLGVFESLLAMSPRPLPQKLSLNRARQAIGNGTIDPGVLEGLRERLVEILPRNFTLPVWPWKAWTPWEDCGANLIFKVTDACGDESAVLLNEGVSEARWEVPAVLDLTLTAREPRRRERPIGWTLVDYLFPETPAWSGSRSGEAGAMLARTA